MNEVSPTSTPGATNAQTSGGAKNWYDSSMTGLSQAVSLWGQVEQVKATKASAGVREEKIPEPTSGQTVVEQKAETPKADAKTDLKKYALIGAAALAGVAVLVKLAK